MIGYCLLWKLMSTNRVIGFNFSVFVVMLNIHYNGQENSLTGIITANQ